MANDRLLGFLRLVGMGERRSACRRNSRGSGVLGPEVRRRHVQADHLFVVDPGGAGSPNAGAGLAKDQELPEATARRDVRHHAADTREGVRGQEPLRRSARAGWEGESPYVERA